MANDLTIQQVRAYLDGMKPVSEIQPTRSQATGQAETSPEGASFSDMLKESLQEVNALSKEADKAVRDLAIGESQDIQGTILAMEKASLSFKLMMEVRNKLLTAYQEVMRTQV